MWTVIRLTNAYKTKHRLIYSGRTYATGERRDLELIATRLNEHAKLTKLMGDDPTPQMRGGSAVSCWR
jgi:hypothetical protein